MALKNVPFRSEVLAWNPDSLADYFRKVSLSLLCFWLGWYAFSGVGREQRRNQDRIWKVYKIASELPLPPAIATLLGGRRTTELSRQCVQKRKIGEGTLTCISP